MSLPQEQWYRQKYEETGDENYRILLNQITKNKETQKDLSEFFKPLEDSD